MKKIILWVIGLISILNCVQIHAQTWEILKDKSIKEIKQNIEKLNSDKNLISNQYSEFKIESNISSYFKKTLSNDDITNIEKLIAQYNLQYNELNVLLLHKAKKLESNEEIKNQLLQVKKDLYISLLEYIDSDKYAEYVNFIRWDATISKKQVEVKSEIASTKQIYDKKVTNIESKIIANRIHLAERINRVVAVKIDEKIKTMKDSPNFKNLPKHLQLEVLEKTIQKVNVNISALESIESKNGNITQKIELYYLLNDKLLIFKNSIQQKK